MYVLNIIIMNSMDDSDSAVMSNFHYHLIYQGLFQDFAQEGANTLWQISRGGNPILNIGKANCQGGGSESTPSPPLK